MPRLEQSGHTDYSKLLLKGVLATGSYDSFPAVAYCLIRIPPGGSTTVLLAPPLIQGTTCMELAESEKRNTYCHILY